MQEPYRKHVFKSRALQIPPGKHDLECAAYIAVYHKSGICPATDNPNCPILMYIGRMSWWTGSACFILFQPPRKGREVPEALLPKWRYRCYGRVCSSRGRGYMLGLFLVDLSPAAHLC